MLLKVLLPIFLLGLLTTNANAEQPTSTEIGAKENNSNWLTVNLKESERRNKESDDDLNASSRNTTTSESNIIQIQLDVTEPNQGNSSEKTRSNDSDIDIPTESDLKQETESEKDVDDRSRNPGALDSNVTFSETVKRFNLEMDDITNNQRSSWTADLETKNLSLNDTDIFQYTTNKDIEIIHQINNETASQVFTKDTESKPFENEENRTETEFTTSSVDDKPKTYELLVSKESQENDLNDEKHTTKHDKNTQDDESKTKPLNIIEIDNKDLIEHNKETHVITKVFTRRRFNYDDSENFNKTHSETTDQSTTTEQDKNNNDLASRNANGFMRLETAVDSENIGHYKDIIDITVSRLWRPDGGYSAELYDEHKETNVIKSSPDAAISSPPHLGTINSYVAHPVDGIKPLLFNPHDGFGTFVEINPNRNENDHPNSFVHHGNKIAMPENFRLLINYKNPLKDHKQSHSNYGQPFRNYYSPKSYGNPLEIYENNNARHKSQLRDQKNLHLNYGNPLRSYDNPLEARGNNHARYENVPINYRNSNLPYGNPLRSDDLHTRYRNPLKIHRNNQTRQENPPVHYRNLHSNYGNPLRNHGNHFKTRGNNHMRHENPHIGHNGPHSIYGHIPTNYGNPFPNYGNYFSSHDPLTYYLVNPVINRNNPGHNPLTDYVNLSATPKKNNKNHGKHPTNQNDYNHFRQHGPLTNHVNPPASNGKILAKQLDDAFYNKSRYHEPLSDEKINDHFVNVGIISAVNNIEHATIPQASGKPKPYRTAGRQFPVKAVPFRSFFL